jgi:hypothetical protein
MRRMRVLLRRIEPGAVERVLAHRGLRLDAAPRTCEHIHMPERDPEPLTMKQRAFVIALLLLGTLIAFAVVYLLNPKGSLGRAGAPAGTGALSHAGGSGR